jgi:AcrR family transcriptional regulator
MKTSEKTTRTRLIEAAVRRFYRDGFRNVGIDQVFSDVGNSKTAFNKHFESKDDLMLAALEVQNGWIQETFRMMIRERGGPTAIGQLHAVLDVVELIIESDDYQAAFLSTWPWSFRCSTNRPMWRLLKTSRLSRTSCSRLLRTQVLTILTRYRKNCA